MGRDRVDLSLTVRGNVTVRGSERDAVDVELIREIVDRLNVVRQEIREDRRYDRLRISMDFHTEI